MNKIKFYREQANLTQDELAKKAKVSLKTISNCELGKFEPKTKTLRKLARALNIDIKELF